MNNILKIGFLLITAIVFVPTTLTAQEPYLYHYTSKNGLPSNNCYYLLQDSDNFIWIATDAGVARYDGDQFETFTIDDGLPDNQILQIKEDKKGRIWFLSLNGKMSYFFKGRIYNSKNDSLLKKLSVNSVVTSFLEDSKGRIWLGTNKNYLAMWDGNKLHSFVSKDITAQFLNAYVHEDKSGTIRVYSTHAVHVMVGNNFRIEDKQEIPLSYKTFNAQPEGRILYLKKDGLYQKSGALTLIKQPINPAYLEKEIGYFYADEKEIWLSTSQGVVVIEPNSNVTSYLYGTAVNQVMKDKSGNFWFTTGSGIYMLPVPLERMYIISTANGLSNNTVMSIRKDANDKYWLGLDKGILDILNPDKSFSKSLSFNNGLELNKKIKQLKFNKNKDQLYFAFDNALGRLENLNQLNPKVTFLKEKNNAQLSIKNFDIDHEENLVLALASGVLLLKPNIFEFTTNKYNQQVRFIQNRAYRVYFDNNQKLWYSNIDGLNGFWNNTTHAFHHQDSLLAERINDIRQLDDETMALATDGYGILIFKDGKIKKTLTINNGLSSNIAYKLFYHNKMLWAITNAGINRINFENDSYDVKAFDYASDLLLNGVNDLYIDDKNAYFATNSGMVYFANTTESKALSSAKVHITKVLVDNKPQYNLQDLTILPHNYKTLSIQYSVVDFSNRNIQYRYRLKEKNSWIEATNNRLEFSALEPGEYNLEIAARYHGQEWGTPTSLKFKLERKFYQSNWFWASIALLTTAIVLRIIVSMNRRQRNKEKTDLTMRNRILTLEQQALQALMNPHFIFNVMNAIQHYINTQEKVAANKMLTGFARLIRKNLDICTKSYITIEEELEYLNLYLSLEKNRFGEKFNYTIHVDSEIDTSEILIPSMLLQPFIENAIWHGLMPRPDMGKVEIDMQVQKDVLIIEISDNGIGIAASKALKNEAHISKGMDLTKERIRLLNIIEQNTIQLKVKERILGGTVVEISIPMNSL